MFEEAAVVAIGALATKTIEYIEQLIEKSSNKKFTDELNIILKYVRDIDRGMYNLEKKYQTEITRLEKENTALKDRVSQLEKPQGCDESEIVDSGRGYYTIKGKSGYYCKHCRDEGHGDKQLTNPHTIFYKCPKCPASFMINY